MHAILRLVTALAVGTSLVVAVQHPSPAVFAALALVAVTSAALAARVLAVAGDSRGSSAIGGRARAHRNVVAGLPAPAHPATPGRTRSRAPAARLLAA